jgi:Uma2 family endonuclease
MSAVIENHARPGKQPPDEQKKLPLDSGDRLTRAEFERRYSQRPDIHRAELIEGVVYVASPVRVVQHGEPHSHIVTWLGVYVANTPGVHIADNATLRLDLDNEPQPDALLWIDASLGGGTHISDDDYLQGTPELIVEVAASSAAYDLHDKLHAYRRNGVQEYLVLLAHERKTLWYQLERGEYRAIEADDQGVLRSRVFPGLWFDSELFWANDLAGLLGVLRHGVESPQHLRFCSDLQTKRSTKRSTR